MLQAFTASQGSRALPLSFSFSLKTRPSPILPPFPPPSIAPSIAPSLSLLLSLAPTSKLTPSPGMPGQINVFRLPHATIALQAGHVSNGEDEEEEALRREQREAMRLMSSETVASYEQDDMLRSVSRDLAAPNPQT